MHSRAPTLFVSHGAPTTALHTASRFARDLRAFAASRPPPRAMAVVSAHWETRGGLRVDTSDAPPLVYDFSGFPPELYAIRYPAKGAPGLAREALTRLRAAGFAAEEQPGRGLDHGAWTPLRLLEPDAAIPLFEVSLPAGARPTELLALGRALAPLREEGVQLLCSGGAVHDLRRFDWDESAPVQPWAEAADRWVAARVSALDAEGIAAGGVEEARAAAGPTPEHLAPIAVALAAQLPGDEVRWIHEGFQHGTLSMRSFALTLKA